MYSNSIGCCNNISETPRNEHGVDGYMISKKKIVRRDENQHLVRAMELKSKTPGTCFGYNSTTQAIYGVEHDTKVLEDNSHLINDAGDDVNLVDLLNRKLQALTGKALIVQVRILYGDNEHDTKLDFAYDSATVGDVCEAIRKKLELTEKEGSIFSLWIMGRDLEFQLQNDFDLHTFVKLWPSMNRDYSHCWSTKDNSEDNFIFLYRRSAAISLLAEQSLKSPVVTNLLYGGAKFNVINGRYPCEVTDAAFLGGIIVHSYLGEYNPSKHLPGYLSSGLYKYVVPRRVYRRLTAARWEQELTAIHKKVSKLSITQARYLFVSYVRKWSCYGASYFPVCMEKPMYGFFELRNQIWYLGVNVRGIFIFDVYNNSHIFDSRWRNVERIRYGKDTLEIKLVNIRKSKKKGKTTSVTRIINLITPQAPLVYNLAVKCRVIYILESLHINYKNNPRIVEALKILPNPCLLSDDTQLYNSNNEDGLLENGETFIENISEIAAIPHTSNVVTPSPQAGSESSGQKREQKTKSKLLKLTNRISRLYAGEKNDTNPFGSNSNFNVSGSIDNNTNMSAKTLNRQNSVVPCKQKGPPKKLKSKDNQLFVSGFSQPSANFSKVAPSTVISVVK